MSITLKPIPVALQRRAAELPCDGVKRYKVGKKHDLSYSEARAAILAESDMGPNAKGGRILKRGTANRLADLNRVYFRHANGFVLKTIEEAKAKTDYKAKHPEEFAPVPPEEQVDDGGVVGSVVELTPTPVAGVMERADGTPVQTEQIITTESPEAQQATAIDVSTMVAGSKLNLVQGDKIVGTLTRNKGGFRCVIDGQEARSRNAATIKELITTALGTGWATATP